MRKRSLVKSARPKLPKLKVHTLGELNEGGEAHQQASAPLTVTAIKAQVKRQGRYSIYVAGKYSFSLSDTALLESKLVNGQVLTKQEIDDFKQLSIDDKLYGLAWSYAIMRPRSTWEMQSYLQRKKASPLLSETILNKLSINNLLDDLSFARSWIASRRLLKPVARRRLMQELRVKRVPEDIARQALDEDETDERTVLRTLVERKRKLTRYQDDQKLMQYLSGQGFSYDDIKSVLRGDEY